MHFPQCRSGMALAALVMIAALASAGFVRDSASGSEAPPAGSSAHTVFVTLTLVEADELVGGFTAEVLYDTAVYTPLGCQPASVCNPAFRPGVAKASRFSGAGFEAPTDLMYLTLLANGDGDISTGQVIVVNAAGDPMQATTELTIGAPAFPLGDVNCDQAINTADLQALLLYFSTQQVTGQCGPFGPDRNLDCDFVIGAGDVLRLLRYFAGIDGPPECGG
jgi:hypothetical protein